MKAIIATKYGSPDVLELQEVEKPTPKADEVLVKTHAAAVNAGDWHMLRADPFLIRFLYGLTAPKHPILGSDMAGTVEAVGTDVTQFQIGDEVFGDLSGSGFGGFAEYTTAPENRLAHKPAGLTFEEAAAVPLAAVTALQALRDHGQIAPGKRVLINGASGGVGTYAVQIAKALGAEVTGVCSTGKMEMVRSIGADHVIDYTQEDFTQNGQQYDLILAANGFQPLSAYERALQPSGDLCHDRRGYGPNVPGHASGAVEVKEGGQEDGESAGEAHPSRSALSEGIARSRQSCACDRQTIPVESGSRRHPLSRSRTR